jgi:hypothetical protein
VKSFRWDFAGLAIFLVPASVFSCVVFIKQIRRSLRTGYWRGRGGVAYRATSPKSFWFGIVCLSLGAAVTALGGFIFLVLPFLGLSTGVR